MTRVRGSKLRTERHTVITDQEFNESLSNAEFIKDVYFRLRALAVLSLLRLTGKRRGEIAQIPRKNFQIDNKFLQITFKLEKKKRRFKRCPNCSEKNSKKAFYCRACGSNIENVLLSASKKPEDSVKAISLSDPLTAHILNFLDYLDKLGNFEFWLPTGKTVFGHYIIYSDRHLTGRQVFNIVRATNESIWPHLFRETVGSDVIKSDPTIIGAFKVQRRLDLEDFKTGFNYLRRYAADIITREQKHPGEVDRIG